MRKRKHDDKHDDIQQGHIIATLANSKSGKQAKRRIGPVIRTNPSMSSVRFLKDDVEKEYKRARSAARRILDDMIDENKRIDDMRELQTYVTLYDACYKPFLYIDEIKGIFENVDFNGKTRIRFNELLSYCIVHYFRNDIQSKRKRILRCRKPECGAYFISKKRSGARYYCPDCSPKNKYTDERRSEYDAQRTLKKHKSHLEDLLRKKYNELKKRGMTDVDAKEFAILSVQEYINDNPRKFNRHIPALEQFLQSFDQFQM
jgi:hypothetical protein